MGQNSPANIPYCPQTSSLTPRYTPSQNNPIWCQIEAEPFRYSETLST